MKTTYIERSNTNKRVFERANAIRNPKKEPGRDIKQFEAYVKSKQAGLLAHTMRSESKDPLRQCVFTNNTNYPIEYTNKRVGRPRRNWTAKTLENIYTINNFGTK